MDVLVSCLVLLVCAVVAIAPYLFQALERERQDTGTELTRCEWCLAAVVVVLGLTAFGAMGNGVLRFQEEFGMYSAVPPLAVSSVLWYSLWLCGWEAGRIERRRSQKDDLWAKRMRVDEERRQQYLKLVDLVAENRDGELAALVQEMKALDDYLCDIE